MEEALQSLLLEDPAIRWPGFRIRRLALNRHMPRVEKLGAHAHDFHQALLYLRGRGVQHVGNEALPVARGSAVVVPPETTHRFEKERRQRPVCLAVDFESEAPWPAAGRLDAARLGAVESRLLELHERRGTRAALDAITGPARRVLEVLGTIEEALAEGPTGRPRGPVSEAVRRIAAESEDELPAPNEMARRLGRSLDHLNRQLRRESGLTVGQTLARIRLERACDRLREPSLAVGEVASAVGLDDQNYFARWFRAHTGQSPTRWREANGVGGDER